jgi:CheY-like chemotaxis protein
MAKKRILVAEDSSEWQKVHLTLLNAYSDMDVTFANSAREGYECVIKNINHPFDLILTDLQMESEFLPVAAGEWFVKQVKALKEYKNIPVVIISAAYNIGFIAHSLGVDHLSKRSIINNPDSYNLMLDSFM